MQKIGEEEKQSRNTGMYVLHLCYAHLISKHL